MESNPTDELVSELKSIGKEGVDWFKSLGPYADETQSHVVREHFATPIWNLLDDKQRADSAAIRGKIAAFGVRMLTAVKTAPLMEQADEIETRTLLRKMSSSLTLKSYSYQAPYPVTEEDRVFGMAPAEQQEDISSVKQSRQSFVACCNRIREKLPLIAPAPHALAQAIVATQTPTIRKTRSDTAFIMMQIDEKQPKLEDVKNCIKEVFKEFDIDAIRSDEIEHADVITQRILDEIRTSEFLIADLTGERPSVYYEVGYAHAVGQRPILFREEGTQLHFDLSVHNVPAYKNVTDLKSKLRLRLSAMMGTDTSPD
jgi:hypothetical protein